MRCFLAPSPATIEIFESIPRIRSIWVIVVDAEPDIARKQKQVFTARAVDSMVWKR
jgi:hypothetical protein